MPESRKSWNSYNSMSELWRSWKFDYSRPESRNHEIHRIQCQNYENHKHLIIPQQNHENHEILRIQCKNNEKQ